MNDPWRALPATSALYEAIWWAFKDKGIVIPKLPGDSIGLRKGLEVNEDFLGRPINGAPDIGAIEIGSP